MWFNFEKARVNNRKYKALKNENRLKLPVRANEYQGCSSNVSSSNLDSLLGNRRSTSAVNNTPNQTIRNQQDFNKKPNQPMVGYTFSDIFQNKSTNSTPNQILKNDPIVINTLNQMIRNQIIANNTPNDALDDYMLYSKIQASSFSDEFKHKFLNLVNSFKLLNELNRSLILTVYCMKPEQVVMINICKNGNLPASF